MTGQRSAPGAGQGSEGQTKSQERTEVAWQFTPTDAQRQKYNRYRVEFREGQRSARCIVESDGTLFRVTHEIRRVPSERVFLVYLKRGLTQRERRSVLDYAQRLPAGEWARFPERWFRRRAGNGQTFYGQLRGTVEPDPLLLLELEMLLENPLLIESGTDRPRLLL